MKLTRFPLIALTLSALAATSQAQVSSHVVRSVDAYGNVVRTQVRTPLADSRSAGEFIAQQGILGANTTSSTTVVYGSSYGNIQQNYCPPTQYAVPTYPYGYPYSYPAVNNNYYYPQLPTTTAIAPPAHSWAQPAWVTNIPLGNSYSTPAYGYPSYPNGGYNQGYGVVTNGYGTPRGNTTTTTTTTTTTRTGNTPDYRRNGNALGYARVGNSYVPILPPGAKPNLILPGYPGNRRN